MESSSKIEFVEVEDGLKVAFSCFGKIGGQAVVCMPGLGDVKESYRLIVPILVEQGYFVVLMDLRGHGDSDGGFASYAPEDVGNDILRVLDAVFPSKETKAVLMGCSYAAASCMWAAAQQPARVKSIVLLGPFVRNPKQSAFTTAMTRVLFLGLWGRAAWMYYFATLFPTKKPQDFALYSENLRGTLDREGHFAALKAMVFASKEECEKRLPEVKEANTPVLVLMGSKDPDFSRPEEEAEWIAQQLSNASVKIVPDAGHYPHHEFPNETAAEVISFLQAHV